jgi:threonine dehydrogenase-like Zn-dependent dehydrogenase
VRKELDILGSRNALRVFPAVIKMLEQRQRPFNELISRVYPFAQAADAFRDWDAAPARVSKFLIEVGG